MTRRILLLTILTILCFSHALASAKPLKIYILSGQSNMEGHARVETFDYIGEDSATAPLLKAMRGPDGKPRVCDNVWISYLTGGQTLGEGFGKLTAGYGSRSNPAESGGKIGPEFTFGLTMEQATDDPILIIKTAWGGKSLNTDFRSPSAGPYTLNASQKKRYAERNMDMEQWKADKAKATGKYYRLMMEHVKKVLADPKRVCPAYDKKEGYEIAGFVWFQGWNDMCDGDTYPNNNEPGAYAEYTELMTHFIRDVRKDLKAPNMPFVIGVIGVEGDRAKGGIANLRPAMAAPAAMPEFMGTVAAVETAPYWDHAMAALQSKKGLADHRLNVAHVITEDGVMEAPEAGVPGWEPIGTLAPEQRTWRFISFDTQKDTDVLEKKEKKRFRDVTLPAGLKGWYRPGFDDSDWDSGKAPIGKGTWKHRLIGKGTVKYKTDWPQGEFILMRTTFEVDTLDYAALRISVLARQGFHIYLNGHKIHTYIWWKDEPQYRPIPLEPDHVKHLKTGKNVLAIYANAEYDRRTEACFATTDLMIEGITQAGLDYVNSQAYVDRQMHKVCTPEEAKIIRGCSNAGYHYLGSAKTLAQIGQAFAQAMLGMEDRGQIAVASAQKIAFLGDSITAAGARSGGYCQLVLEGLKKQGITTEGVFAGISGHKSNQMLARLERDVLSKKPHWMTLSCGVNDVWHGKNGVKLEDYKTNITAIVDRAQAEGIKVMILTSTMIKEDQSGSLNQQLLPYNAFLKKLAGEKGCLFADLNSDMQQALKTFPKNAPKDTKLTSDGVHMNPYGNIMMAKGILKTFGVSGAALSALDKGWKKTPGRHNIRFNVSMSLAEYEQLQKTLDVSVREFLINATNEAKNDRLKR